MAHAGESVEAAAGDGLVHADSVGDGRLAVLLAPEDVRGNVDLREEGADICTDHAGHRLAHDRVGFLVVVDAQEAVEPRSTARGRRLAEGAEQYLARLRERESRHPTDTGGAAGPCRRAEVQVRDPLGVAGGQQYGDA